MNFLVHQKLKLIIAVVLFSIVITSCNNSKRVEEDNAAKGKAQEVIQDLETKMHASLSLNATIGQVAAQEYFKYAATYPDDSLAAIYLFKGGEVATAIQNYSDALHAYEQITSNYPTFRYARESLYLQGFLLDNYLNDDAKAKTIYEKFLSTYTTGPFVEDAKAAIANLGKTDEELIKEFKKKNGEK